MNETLVISGGIYMLALIVFHVLFWRIFRWPESLSPLNKVNKSTMQVLNLSITFIFAIFAYISFVHTEELVNTSLGKTMLILISLLWLIRAVLQVIFYGFRHSASVGLTAFFLLGAMLYGIPGIA
jgi:hypothetical protein